MLFCFTVKCQMHQIHTSSKCLNVGLLKGVTNIFAPFIWPVGSGEILCHLPDSHMGNRPLLGQVLSFILEALVPCVLM